MNEIVRKIITHKKMESKTQIMLSDLGKSYYRGAVIPRFLLGKQQMSRSTYYTTFQFYPNSIVMFHV